MIALLSIDSDLKDEVRDVLGSTGLSNSPRNFSGTRRRGFFLSRNLFGPCVRSISKTVDGLLAVPPATRPERGVVHTGQRRR